jgi:hypothetical protein
MGRRKFLGLVGAAIVLIAVVSLWELPLSSQEVLHHEHRVNLDEPGECLGCHDGVTAPGVSFCTSECAVGSTSSHPVYRRYPPLRKRSEFASRSQVEAAGIRLTDGRVSCVSCHDLTNDEKYHLVIDNRHSRLCMTCHIR